MRFGKKVLIGLLALGLLLSAFQAAAAGKKLVIWWWGEQEFTGLTAGWRTPSRSTRKSTPT